MSITAETLIAINRCKSTLCIDGRQTTISLACVSCRNRRVRLAAELQPVEQLRGEEAGHKTGGEAKRHDMVVRINTVGDRYGCDFRANANDNEFENSRGNTFFWGCADQFRGVRHGRNQIRGDRGRFSDSLVEQVIHCLVRRTIAAIVTHFSACFWMYQFDSAFAWLFMVPSFSKTECVR